MLLNEFGNVWQRQATEQAFRDVNIAMEGLGAVDYGRQKIR